MSCSLAVVPNASASRPVRPLGILRTVPSEVASDITGVYCVLGLGSMVGDSVLRLHDLQRSCCAYQCYLLSNCREALCTSTSCVVYLTCPGPKSSEKKPVSEEEIVDILNISISNPPDRVSEDYLLDNLVNHMTVAYEQLRAVLRRVLVDFR